MSREYNEFNNEIIKETNNETKTNRSVESRINVFEELEKFKEEKNDSNTRIESKYNQPCEDNYCEEKKAESAYQKDVMEKDKTSSFDCSNRVITGDGNIGIIQSDLPYKSVVEILENTTEKEKLLYSQIPLEVCAVDDRESLQRTDIDFLTLDSNGKCILEKTQNGYAPRIDGKPIELHHIGQSMDAPLAELTSEEHRGKENFSVLHDLSIDTQITRSEFSKEKKHYWKVRTQDIIEQEINKSEDREISSKKTKKGTRQ